MTAAMIVAGLAASVPRLGRRVLAAQTHEQPFGVAFGLGVGRTGDESVVVQAASGVWASPKPLLGTGRPGVLVDLTSKDEWSARAADAELVLVHVNHDGGLPRTAGVPMPDEVVIVVGDWSREWSIPAYRAIKRTVSWNPSAVLGLIAVGVHEPARSPWERLVQAVSTFLGRQCPVLGSISDASALSHAFLSGTVLREGWDELTYTLTPIASRWLASNAGTRRVSIPASARDTASSQPGGGGAEDRSRGGG